LRFGTALHILAKVTQGGCVDLLIFISGSPVEGVVFMEMAQREGLERVQCAFFG
jgi:hypothetical protein